MKQKLWPKWLTGVGLVLLTTSPNLINAQTKVATCGSAHMTDVTAKPTANFCAVGSRSRIYKVGNQYKWSCTFAAYRKNQSVAQCYANIVTATPTLDTQAPAIVSGVGVS